MLFDDTLDLELSTPIKLAELEYSVLKLSEPTAEQLMAHEKVAGAMAALAMLIHLNAKVPMKVVSQMKQRDLARAADFFAHFNETSPGSATSSPN
ncbi:MAG: phage tail assembly protein [Dokdonella sp.]|uniref:phage tail assembly protein n=1 Tax=Dokdonella sp. TaxID=2291710 RepID=UPI003F7EE2EE